MGLPFYPLSQTHTKFRIVPDTLVDGCRFRILCVIDDFSRECLAAVVDNSISGERVARSWMRSPNIVAPRPAGSAAPIPDVLRSRTHPKRRAEIAAGSRCRMALHRARKAHANGFVESFNGRRRDECLNEHLFRSYRHARDIIEEWRIAYDLNKPHTSLDGLTPTEFAN